MSLTTRVLIALAAGLAAGIAISVAGSASLAAAATAVEPVGTLWVNALRMTVIPLVVSSLVVGVTAAPDPRIIGDIGWRALLLFLALLVVGALFALVTAPPILARIPLDPAAISALQASATQAAGAVSEGAQRIPTLAQWVVDLVPVNPIKSASDGAMLPLIVFTLAFAIALSRVAAEPRDAVVRVFAAVADASLVLVRWVLALAPVGVFALALPLATRLGLAAAGAVASYVVMVAAAAVVFMAIVLYPLVAIAGRISPVAFMRAVFPAQAVAFSSRSSLAALPAMMESARTRLALPDAITSFFLPLAASTFRVGGAVGQTMGVLFIARLYGVSLDPGHLATVVLTMIVMTFSIPGIPGGSIIAMIPVLATAGVPVSGVGILLGVDTIPDMFRTTTNVTGDMVAATILGRRRGERA